jgi:hypothetical protein
MSQVDQVRAVGEAAICRIDAVVFAPLNKQFGMLRIHGCRIPFALILQKQSEGVGPASVSRGHIELYICQELEDIPDVYQVDDGVVYT